MEELNIVHSPTLIAQDNSSALDRAEGGNEKHFAKRKHIYLKMNYAIDLGERKMTKLEQVESSEMVADYLTKPLAPTENVKAITHAKIFSWYMKGIHVYHKFSMLQLNCLI